VKIVSAETEVKTYHRKSLVLIATSMCAALYAIGAYVTAYIPSPWGFGQFRPAVVIPAFFAAIFGPWAAAVGAAVGTLIADSVKHGALYYGSLIAAVPGNFIGFYLFGYIVRKFSWTRFILASNLTLTVANLIVAFLYVFAYRWLYLSAYVNPNLTTLAFISIGLTVWWFVTMLPFVLLITPILIRATAIAVPSIVSEELRTCSLRKELPKTMFSLAMLVPGIIMLLVGLISITYADFGKMFSLTGAALAVIQIFFCGSGGALSALGVMIYTGQKFLWRGVAK
jgi:energy-coupling factor transport system substrate-specific component